jgi:RNA polymerase sigma-70 factor (ECF subfamily)
MRNRPSPRPSGAAWSDLLLRARGGDEAAFAALVEQAQPFLFARARERLAAPGRHGRASDEELADALAGQALVRAWGHLTAFDPARANGQTWLQTILDNLVRDALDQRRRQRRREAVVLESGGGPGEDGEPVDLEPEDEGRPSPPEAADRPYQRALLQEALARLSPAEQTILHLGDVEGLSYKEIADRLGCTPGAVGPRLTRARKRLREALGPRD